MTKFSKCDFDSFYFQPKINFRIYNYDKGSKSY